METDAIYREGGVDAGKITLTKLTWFMPKAIPTPLTSGNELLKLIESKITIEVAYPGMQCIQRAMQVTTDDIWPVTTKKGTQRPRWLIVGFQTGKVRDQTQNPAIFDHVGVTNIYATINDRRYPNQDITAGFASYKISRLFWAMKLFKEQYLGVPSKESVQSISGIEFVELYPIHVIDLRRQNEKLQDESLNIMINMTFADNIPPNTIGYALLISDRKFYLQSDGKKFQMVIN